MTIQITDVKKILASVRRLCEGASRVVFDAEEDAIRKGTGGNFIPNRRTECTR